MLSHFLVSYSTQSFLIEIQCSLFLNDFIELSHFVILSFILKIQSFCYSARSFHNFVNHCQDLVSYFTTVLYHLTKLIGHSWVFIHHSLKWLRRASRAEGGWWLDRGWVWAVGGSQARWTMARTGLRGTEANTQLDWLGRLDELLGPVIGLLSDK
jgi:hypothetical protein